ncbi:Uncharacterised protein [Mycobacterium tuberculosis]|nr:Uncharacterised protein [Mycobacterium tuberculosis]CKS25914.1 Uncharacterised protein [Mycobacterium tuberculosis]
MNAGIPIVNQAAMVTWIGWNGNNSGSRRSGMAIKHSIPTSSASNTEYTVLVRNRLATRSILPMTRRPSPTTWGSVANRLFSNTICATAREAGLPEPIATPISASLRASTSLTPSPVIATVCPCDCRACTIARFWSGRTRPKLV